MRETVASSSFIAALLVFLPLLRPICRMSVVNCVFSAILERREGLMDFIVMTV